ncbi:hypothetical protein BT93_A1653 [Corymbia citriodora subsp. variegata]|nr:hypothetical protein BT93_A1653 [Corymbia citriodora subsp. variegata]
MTWRPPVALSYWYVAKAEVALPHTLPKRRKLEADLPLSFNPQTTWRSDLPMAGEDDVESRPSRTVDAPAPARARDQRQKLEAYNEVLRRLRASACEEARVPGFDDQLWLHFHRFPARYALDVNVERAEDVLTHKRLLELAADPAKQPVFDIRPVRVCFNVNENPNESVDLDSAMADGAQSSPNHSGRVGIHLPPRFGLSSNLEGLNLQANRYNVEDEDSVMNSDAQVSRPMHEITFSALDKRKLLSELTALVAEIGLYMQEAHAFSTVDGFFLGVFVVDGWLSEEEELRKEVEKGILKLKFLDSITRSRPSTYVQLVSS